MGVDDRPQIPTRSRVGIFLSSEIEKKYRSKHPACSHADVILDGEVGVVDQPVIPARFRTGILKEYYT